MSSGLGLFGWIRDGVKQSVLLGVSDAIDTIGSPENANDLNPAMLSFARQLPSKSVNLTVDDAGQRRPPTVAGRKRLGRSLRDIEPKNPSAS